MKRLFCMLLCLCLLGAAALGESEIKISGGFGYTVNDDGSLTIVSYEGKSPALTVPAKLDGKDVTRIGKSAFEGAGISLVNLPEGVIAIDEAAFKDCESLVTVVLPGSLQSIGRSAFRNCASMRYMLLPEGVTSIGAGAFFGCVGLNAIDLPAGLTEIPKNAFYGCSALESIVVPEGVTTIGSTAFMDCARLSGVTLPEGLTEIAAGAFGGCEALFEITLPESLVSVGYGALDCPNLIAKVVKGSAAEQKCKDYGVKYTYVEEEK